MIKILVFGYEPFGRSVLEHPAKVVADKIRELAAASGRSSLVPGAEVFSSLKRGNLDNISIHMSKKLIEKIEPDVVIMVTEDSEFSSIIVEPFDMKHRLKDADEHVKRQFALPDAQIRALKKADIAVEFGVEDGSFMTRYIDNKLLSWIRIPPHSPENITYHDQPHMESDKVLEAILVAMKSCVELNNTPLSKLREIKVQRTSLAILDAGHESEHSAPLSALMKKSPNSKFIHRKNLQTNSDDNPQQASCNIEKFNPSTKSLGKSTKTAHFQAGIQKPTRPLRDVGAGIKTQSKSLRNFDSKLNDFKLSAESTSRSVRSIVDKATQSHAGMKNHPQSVKDVENKTSDSQVNSKKSPSNSLRNIVQSSSTTEAASSTGSGGHIGAKRNDLTSSTKSKYARFLRNAAAKITKHQFDPEGSESDSDSIDRDPRRNHSLANGLDFGSKSSQAEGGDLLQSSISKFERLSQSETQNSNRRKARLSQSESTKPRRRTFRRRDFSRNLTLSSCPDDDVSESTENDTSVRRNLLPSGDIKSFKPLSDDSWHRREHERDIPDASDDNTKCRRDYTRIRSGSQHGKSITSQELGETRGAPNQIKTQTKASNLPRDLNSDISTTEQMGGNPLPSRDASVLSSITKFESQSKLNESETNRRRFSRRSNSSNLLKQDKSSSDNDDKTSETINRFESQSKLNESETNRRRFVRRSDSSNILKQEKISSDNDNKTSGTFENSQSTVGSAINKFKTVSSVIGKFNAAAKNKNSQNTFDHRHGHLFNQEHERKMPRSSHHEVEEETEVKSVRRSSVKSALSSKREENRTKAIGRFRKAVEGTMENSKKKWNDQSAAAISNENREAKCNIDLRPVGGGGENYNSLDEMDKKIRVVVVAFENKRRVKKHPAKLVIDEILRASMSSQKILVPRADIFVIHKKNELDNGVILNSLTEIAQLRPDAIILLTEDAKASELVIGKLEKVGDGSCADESAQSRLPDNMFSGIQLAEIPTKICDDDDQIFKCQHLGIHLLGWIRMPLHLPETRSYHDQPAMSTADSLKGVLAAIHAVVEEFQNRNLSKLKDLDKTDTRISNAGTKQNIDTSSIGGIARNPPSRNSVLASVNMFDSKSKINVTDSSSKFSSGASKQDDDNISPVGNENSKISSITSFEKKTHSANQKIEKNQETIKNQGFLGNSTMTSNAFLSSNNDRNKCVVANEPKKHIGQNVHKTTEDHGNHSVSKKIEMADIPKMQMGHFPNRTAENHGNHSASKVSEMADKPKKQIGHSLNKSTEDHGNHSASRKSVLSNISMFESKSKSTFFFDGSDLNQGLGKQESKLLEIKNEVESKTSKPPTTPTTTKKVDSVGGVSSNESPAGKIRVLVIGFESKGRSKVHPAILVSEKILKLTLRAKDSIVKGADILALCKRSELSKTAILTTTRQIQDAKPKIIILLSSDAEASELVVGNFEKTGNVEGSCDSSIYSNMPHLLTKGFRVAGVPARVSEVDEKKFECEHLNPYLVGWIRLPPDLPTSTSYHDQPCMGLDESVKAVIAGIRSIVKEFSKSTQTNQVDTPKSRVQRFGIIKRKPSERSISVINESSSHRASNQSLVAKSPLLKMARAIDNKAQPCSKIISNTARRKTKGSNKISPFNEPKHSFPSKSKIEESKSEPEVSNSEAKHTETNFLQRTRPMNNSNSTRNSLNVDPKPATKPSGIKGMRRFSTLSMNVDEINEMTSTNSSDSNSEGIAPTAEPIERMRVLIMGFESKSIGSCHPAKIVINRILEMASATDSTNPLIPGAEVFAFFKKTEFSNYAIKSGMRQIEQVQPNAIIMLTEDSATSDVVVGSWETDLTMDSSHGINKIPEPGASLNVGILGSFNKAPFSEVYCVKEMINSGMFGSVHKGYHFSSIKNKDGDDCSDDDIVAIKVINRVSATEDASVINEASVVKELADVPNILKLYDFYMDQEKIYMVTNFANGGDILESCIEAEAYTEKDACKAMYEFLEIMKTLHIEKKIVHRDIKPENLLLHNSKGETSLVLCDFGYAKYLPKGPDGYLYSHVGTPTYLAPEIVNGDPYRAEVDMWSIGCTIFILLGGYQPFEGDSDMETFQYIVTADYDFDDQAFKSVSDEAKYLIKNLLELDGAKRWDVTQALECEWFKKYHLSGDDSPNEGQVNLSGTQHKLRIYRARRKLKAAIHVLRVATMFGFHDAENFKQDGPLTQANLPQCLLTGIQKAGIPHDICDDEVFVCKHKIDADLIGWIRIPPYLPETKLYDYQAVLESEQSVQGVLGGIQAMVNKRGDVISMKSSSSHKSKNSESLNISSQVEDSANVNNDGGGRMVIKKCSVGKRHSIIGMSPQSINVSLSSNNSGNQGAQSKNMHSMASDDFEKISDHGMVTFSFHEDTTHTHALDPLVEDESSAEDDPEEDIS